MTPTIFDVSAFRRTLLGERPGLGEVFAMLADYRLMLGAVLESIVRRFEANGDYHFIDTKLSLIDGRDFDPADPIRGKGVIYGWIQGRGLEALAGHYDWLMRQERIDPAQRDELGQRLRRMTGLVLESMEKLRAANGGRLFFMMTPEGRPLRVGPDGHTLPHEVPPDAPVNFSDVFYVKGLLAAASMLGQKDRVRAAEEWFDRIVAEINRDNFASDQQSLDPKNTAIGSVPGRRSHGPRMIGIGAAATFVQYSGQKRHLEAGLEFIDYVLAHHVNLAGDNAVSKQYDMWEFTDAGKMVSPFSPFLEPGNILRNDPGHATEFVGLALRLLRAAGKRGLLAGVDPARLANYRRVLPLILKQNFETGFSPSGLGMVKAADLVSRKPLYDDMPWWNLPETMRAAVEACEIVHDAEKLQYADIARRSSNAFLGNFVRPELNLMASQTLDAAGKPVPIVPATPDADPGYHTGLSIIDCLDLIEELLGQV